MSKGASPATAGRFEGPPDDLHGFSGVGGKEVTKLVPTNSVGGQGEIFAMLGSSGYMEVAANRNPAAKLIGVNRGAEVLLTLG